MNSCSIKIEVFYPSEPGKEFDAFDVSSFELNLSKAFERINSKLLEQPFWSNAIPVESIIGAYGHQGHHL